MHSMPGVSRDDFLGVFTMFRKSPEQLVGDILASGSHKTFAKDAALYTDGDSCPGIGFFLSGEVRVFKTGDSGREITLYDVFPGETCILNASCILSRQHYPANAVALQGGDVLLIPAETFRGLVARYEDMRGFVFRLFSLRFVEIMELLEEVAFGKMDRRLLDYLVEKSENGVLQATHQQIANDLGTSREVVSRLLKDFERQGSIGLSRNLITIKAA